MSCLFDEQEMQRKGEDIGEEEDDEWYSRKLEGGLFTLQIVDYIIGWISMEDDGVGLLCVIPAVCVDTSLLDPRTYPVHARTAGSRVE